MPKVRANTLAVFVFTTISIRVATYFIPDDTAIMTRVVRVLDVFQVGTLMWSLLTNLSATSIIGHKAW